MYVTGLFTGHSCQWYGLYVSSWPATSLVALAGPCETCTDAYPTLLPGRLRSFPSHCPFPDVLDDIRGVTVALITPSYKLNRKWSLKINSSNQALLLPTVHVDVNTRLTLTSYYGSCWRTKIVNTNRACYVGTVPSLHHKRTAFHRRRIKLTVCCL